MNNQSNTLSTTGSSSQHAPDGYILLLSTPNIFGMDLVAKNLQMNGIDAVCFYPDPVELRDGASTLFVKAEQKEQASVMLASLDLIDFTITNG